MAVASQQAIPKEQGSHCGLFSPARMRPGALCPTYCTALPPAEVALPPGKGLCSPGEPSASQSPPSKNLIRDPQPAKQESLYSQSSTPPPLQANVSLPAPLPKNKPNIPNKQHLKIERNPFSLTQKAMQVYTKCCHCPFCVKETHICRGGQEKDAKLQVPGEPEREEPGSTQQRHGISPTSGAGVNLTHRGRV